MKKILVFASGTKSGGGSGFEYLARDPRFVVVAVVSNHPAGGVYQKAQDLGIPFELFIGPYDEAGYGYFIEKYKPDLVVFAGWLKLAVGLDPKKTVNIHPGPLPEFGGPGMYGMRVHQAVLNSNRSHSAVTIHFVTAEYDAGPPIFVFPVPVLSGDTAEILQARVNIAEHWYYGTVVDLVLQSHTHVNPQDLPAIPEATT
ncbi:MAG: formyltransferase family protein [Patescibacteria group bacterium]